MLMDVNGYTQIQSFPAQVSFNRFWGMYYGNFHWEKMMVNHGRNVPELHIG